MNRRFAPVSCMLLAATLAAAPGLRAAEDAVILFGQSAALEGPTQELGEGMRLGLEAAFNEITRLAAFTASGWN